MDSLTIIRVPLDSLAPDPANPRLHDAKNLDAIRASLQRFGQAEPVVTQARTRRIIAGHGRLAAMKGLGWTEVDIVELDVDDVQAAALGVAMNRAGELATWDDRALTAILKSLETEGGLEGTGFDAAELDDLIAQLEAEDAPAGVEDPGPTEPPEIPVTQKGDLWILDDHRLLGGDSTNADDMARLMDGQRASLFATDSPYLVDYRGGNHPQSWSNKAEVKDKHWDDYVDPATGLAFFSDFLRVGLAHCIERVPVYNWHATRRQVLVEEAWKANGLLVHQTIVWRKARAVLTRSHYMWQHEPCFYGWPEGFMPDSDRRPPPNEKTVWDIDQVGQQDGIHPTQKPVEIFARPIAYHTKPNEICLESFSGSGTQIIAAEMAKRRCFAMELAPAYVDAAVERWQKATGKLATLEATGQTFDEVALERQAAD